MSKNSFDEQLAEARRNTKIYIIKMINVCEMCDSPSILNTFLENLKKIELPINSNDGLREFMLKKHRVYLDKEDHVLYLHGDIILFDYASIDDAIQKIDADVSAFYANK